MDKQTEKEVERLDKRIDSIEDEQKEQSSILSKLAKDVMRFWHVGIGIAAGLLLDKLGLEKIITKLL